MKDGRWKRDFDEYRSEAANGVYHARKFGKRIQHDFVDKVVPDKEWADEAEAYLNKQEDFTLNLPNNKKKGKMKNQRFKKANGRSRLRRRITRRYKRKPSARRPRAGSRMKGLRSMIKKIGIESAEKQLHIVSASAINLTEGVFYAEKLNTPVVINNPLTAESTRFNLKGRSFFAKGIRVKGYIHNASQIPAVCKMWIVQSKTAQAPVLNDILNANQRLFWNPITGSSNTYTSLPPLWQVNPKLAPGGSFKALKQMTLKMNSSRRDEGTPVDGQAFASEDTSDTVHFDIYVPLNRTFTMDGTSGAENTVAVLSRQIYIMCIANPHAIDLQFGTVFPRLTYQSIMYYRDP
jgi:hypothetical protein